MYALVVSLAVACVLLQVTHCRPDFGIQGKISGTSKIVERAILAKQHFLRVDDYIIPDQKSDIGKLQDAAVILQAIGLQVNTLGPALMDTITTATDDDQGNVETTFTLISIARLTFEDYIGVVLQEQIQNLETLLGVYIRDQLLDDFFHIQARLTALKGTLETLQQAVQAAYTAANGGPVSDELIKQFIDVDLIAQLTRHLTLLAYRIPVLTYTITSSLENIEQGDDYFYGLVQDSDRVLNEIETTGTDFYQRTVEYSTLVEQTMNQLITDFAGEMVAATATATQLNLPALTAAIAGLKTVQDTKLAATLNAYMDLYVPTILELSTMLPIETNFSFLPGDNPAAVLVGVLIANGPFSRFCFWKYASLLHNLLLVSNFASECYDREYNRLSSLQEALLIEIELISYDLEIVNPYTAVCMYLPSSAAQRQTPCATEYSAYFGAISSAFDKKLTAFVKLAEIELKATKQRLSVCWSTRMQQTLGKFETIVPQILACADNGPNA
uniref:Protein TsetseEP domain-containing protein n=1 Tax=Anopheles farauti TaxID=69004 RepID=A0A182Q6W6_9DIPT